MSCDVCGAPTGWVHGWQLEVANECKREAIARRKQVEAKNAELLAALVEARDSVAYWADYVSRYFQEKHNVAGELAKIDAVIERNKP